MRGIYTRRPLGSKEVVLRRLGQQPMLAHSAQRARASALARSSHVGEWVSNHASQGHSRSFKVIQTHLNGGHSKPPSLLDYFSLIHLYITLFPYSSATRQEHPTSENTFRQVRTCVCVCERERERERERETLCVCVRACVYTDCSWIKLCKDSWNTSAKVRHVAMVCASVVFIAVGGTTYTTYTYAHTNTHRSENASTIV